MSLNVTCVLERMTIDQISFYEVIGRDLVIYWRGMKAGSTQTIHIDVVAAIPGFYSVSILYPLHVIVINV
jgi:hypothetical protein